MPPPFAQLERKYAARLGVYALDTGSGAVIAHRADERFAFCSTFKTVAAAALLSRPTTSLDKVVHYTEDDLMAHAPVTRRHVRSGMTIRQLCDAAVRYSDGTAGNLLVRELGGPARLTAYVRGLGDTVTRMDRVEPALTTAVPGDPRDTTSPRAFGDVYRRIVLGGGGLPEARRAFLSDLLLRNTTGDGRIRAGVPRGWTVADKTGTGAYGTQNDIAVVWPPGALRGAAPGSTAGASSSSPPVVIALMSSKKSREARRDESLLAEAASYVAAAFS